MTFTGKDDDSRKSELEIFLWFEAELLRLYPWLPWIDPTLQIPEKSLVAKGTRHPGKQRDVKRFNPIDPKCINRLRVVAPSHAATFTGPPPVFALADRDLVVCQVKRGVCVQ